MLEAYTNAWAKFDPNATGIIQKEFFSDFMFTLGDPLGWD